MPTELADWFLTAAERANDATDLPSWRDGNDCTPLVHGVEYFRRLAECVGQAGDGDQVFFTDWRGDPDQKLTADGPTVAEMFEARRAPRGVRARPGLALAHRRAAVQRAREPLARPRDRGVGRSGDPRPAGAPDGQPPPEAGGGPLSRPPGARRGLRRRDRPVPQPARRRRSTPATRSRCGWRRRTGRTRRGTTCSWRSVGRRSPTSRRCSASAGTTRPTPTRTTRSPGCSTGSGARG